MLICACGASKVIVLLHFSINSLTSPRSNRLAALSISFSRIIPSMSSPRLIQLKVFSCLKVNIISLLIQTKIRIISTLITSMIEKSLSGWKCLSFEIYNNSQKVMLHYSNISRPAPLDASLRLTAAKENYPVVSTPNRKKLTYKPAFLDIPKQKFELPNQVVLTPKTARSTYANPNLNSSFNRSPGLTPDKKQSSFLHIKPSQPDHNDSSCEGSDIYPKKLQFRSSNNDRSRKIVKNVMFQDTTNGNQSEAANMRQTVTNPTSWSIKNNLPPKPIKTQADFGQQNAKNQRSARKKVESQYTPHYYHEEEKQSKFVPRNHIRNKTSFEEESNPLKIKQLSQNITPRMSQEKLTKSVNVKTTNPMSVTDPSGSYFQRAVSKRLSSTISVRERNQLSLADFQVGSCRGEGRFGKVFPAVHKKTGFLVAIKQVKKESVRLMLEQFTQQLKISLFLNHPNVVKMYGFFHDSTSFYIMMEYMQEGTLYKMIKMKKRLPEEEAVARMAEVCRALNYLHEEDILHRDIKPENIVLTNGVCKLCDFGWATYSKDRRTTYCGTLDYVCPEILQGESYDSFVDIWAIGVLAYQMLTGKAPFYHISRQQTMKSIMKCDFAFPEQMSSEARQFITHSLQKDPNYRVTVAQLLKDRWLRDELPPN